jgi:hypothetical protein
MPTTKLVDHHGGGPVKIYVADNTEGASTKAAATANKLEYVPRLGESHNLFRQLISYI